MQHLNKMFSDMLFETLIWLQNAYEYITRKPKAKPSLLAINTDWFTNCNWRDQLIAFKQIDSYRSYKH